MAVIYYVKDGPRPTNATPGREIAVADIEVRLAGRRVKYLSAKPPEINPDAPSQYPNHVVIEIETGEPLGAVFNKVGFFLVVGMSPDEAEPLVFPSGSPRFRV